MSHIPNSAMPHAGPTEALQDRPAGEQEAGLGIGARAGQLADYARENPKTAAAAGVALVGAIAAAAIPLVRGRKSDSAGAGGSTKKTKQKA